VNYRLIALIGLSFSTLLQAIEVSNRSSYDLYGAPYYMRKEARKAGKTQMIPAGDTVSFTKPSIKLLEDRMFVFSAEESDLKDTLSSSAFHLLPSVGIGVGNDFFLDLDGGSFKGYNFAEWKVIEPLKKKWGDSVGKAGDYLVDKMRNQFVGSSREESVVRKSTDIPQAEKNTIGIRKNVVRNALSDLTGMNLTQREVPTIAVAGSGGGYRAMLGFLGFLHGAEDTGLLDTISYMSALSGSTWTLGPWISSGWTIEEFRKRLTSKISNDLFNIKPSVSTFAYNLLMRLSYNQPIGGVNVYGRILAYNLLKDLPGGPFEVYLHDQQERIAQGDYPFPIYTAIATKLPYEWVEFTPYEMGGDYFGGYIPIADFGAPFLNGKRAYHTPPYSLAFILGICGSAFSVPLKRMLTEVENGIPLAPLRNVLKTGAEEFTIGNYRISTAQVFNWTWGMRPLPRAEQKIIKLIDGGISYNFGLESLYRRKPNFVIIGDYSKGEVGGELKKAVQELQERGFKVPPVTFDDLTSKSVWIFKDPNDRSVPTIIYFPFSKGSSEGDFDPRSCLKSWCDTYNFRYVPEDSQSLIEFTRKQVQEAFPEILEELRSWIEAKRA